MTLDGAKRHHDRPRSRASRGSPEKWTPPRGNPRYTDGLLFPPSKVAAYDWAPIGACCVVTPYASPALLLSGEQFRWLADVHSLNYLFNLLFSLLRSATWSVRNKIPCRASTRWLRSSSSLALTGHSKYGRDREVSVASSFVVPEWSE